MQILNYQKSFIQSRLEGALNKVAITAGVACLISESGMKPQIVSKILYAHVTMK